MRGGGATESEHDYPDQTPRRETDAGSDGPGAAIVAAALAQTTDRAKPEPDNLSGDRPAIYVACLAS